MILLFQSAKLNCNGDYVNVATVNTLCVTVLEAIKEVRNTTFSIADELYFINLKGI